MFDALFLTFESLPSRLTWQPLDPVEGEAIFAQRLAKAGSFRRFREADGTIIDVVFVDDIAKAGGGSPKYIKRWMGPNGKWRYAYARVNAAGKATMGAGHFDHKANPTHFAPGSSFAHGDGHYTVHGTDERTGKLVLTHSSNPGAKVRMDHDEFSAHLKEHHAGLIDAHRDALQGAMKDAREVGNAGAMKKLAAEAKRHGYEVPAAEKKAVSPAAGAAMKHLADADKHRSYAEEQRSRRPMTPLTIQAAQDAESAAAKADERSREGLDFSGGAPGPGKTPPAASEAKPAAKAPTDRVEHATPTSKHLERVSWEPNKAGENRGKMRIHYKDGAVWDAKDVHHGDYQRVVNGETKEGVHSHGKAYDQHIRGMHEMSKVRDASPKTKAENNAQRSADNRATADAKQKAAAEFHEQKKASETKAEGAKKGAMASLAAKADKHANQREADEARLAEDRKLMAKPASELPSLGRHVEGPSAKDNAVKAPAKGEAPTHDALVTEASERYGLKPSETAHAKRLSATDVAKHLGAGDHEKARNAVKTAVHQALYQGDRNMSPSSATKHMRERESGGKRPARKSAMSKVADDKKEELRNNDARYAAGVIAGVKHPSSGTGEPEPKQEPATAATAPEAKSGLSLRTKASRPGTATDSKAIQTRPSEKVRQSAMARLAESRKPPEKPPDPPSGGGSGGGLEPPKIHDLTYADKGPGRGGHGHAGYDPGEVFHDKGTGKTYVALSNKRDRVSETHAEDMGHYGVKAFHRVKAREATPEEAKRLTDWQGRRDAHKTKADDAKKAHDAVREEMSKTGKSESDGPRPKGEAVQSHGRHGGTFHIDKEGGTISHFHPGTYDDYRTSAVTVPHTPELEQRIREASKAHSEGSQPFAERRPTVEVTKPEPEAPKAKPATPAAAKASPSPQSGAKLQYRKTREGDWAVFGPAHMLKEGRSHDVHTSAGKVKQEHVHKVSRPFNVDGVPHAYGYLKKGSVNPDDDIVPDAMGE